jgi:beta-glucosidase
VDPEGEVKDEERLAFLEAHLRAAHEALERGVDLKGYFVWSLLDNFEWTEGYRPTFGLVSVDRETFVRTPKPSLAWLGEVARRTAWKARTAASRRRRSDVSRRRR